MDSDQPNADSSLSENPGLETLKEHVAWDRTSWSIKSICNRLLQNAYGWKDVLKVEYNDPHEFALKLRVFPITLQN